jgi:small subunit ribosomal protein S17
MDKTIVVDVSWRSSHRIYKKAVSRRTRLYVHDPANDAKLGDIVRVTESRPFSKTKRWRLTEVLTRADLAEIQPDEITLEDESVLVAQREAPPEPAGVAMMEQPVDEIDDAIAADDVIAEEEEAGETAVMIDEPVAEDDSEAPEAEDESEQAISEDTDETHEEEEEDESEGRAQ